MNLLTDEQVDKLRENGSLTNRDKDHYPVVRLFLPGTRCTWLLTELDPEDENRAFGLCDLGMGFPELGYVDLHELVTLQFAFQVKNDLDFIGKYPISVYARAARHEQAITYDSHKLKIALKP